MASQSVVVRLVGKRRKVMDPIMSRVELVNGTFPLEANTLSTMTRIREILETADRELAALFIREKQPIPEDEEAPIAYEDVLPHDKGRVIHGFDLIQQAKNAMIDGLILKKAIAKAESPSSS